jgi:hypothetical protein
MWISRQRAGCGVFVGLALAALLACKPGECLRFSDCNAGLSCVEGTCVAPITDAGADAKKDASGDARDDARRDGEARDGHSDAATGRDADTRDADKRDGEARDGDRDGQSSDGRSAADGASPADGQVDGAALDGSRHD